MRGAPGESARKGAGTCDIAAAGPARRSSSSSTLFTFSLLRLFPGDVADASSRSARQAQKQQFSEDNGLDKPFFEQYATWLGNLAAGRPRQGLPDRTSPVSDKIETALPGLAPAHALRADHRAA